MQLFDSWVGALSPADYEEFVAPWSARILAGAGAPTIHFGTGASTLLPAMARAGGDVIGLDWRIALDDGWALVGEGHGVQGNLDPAVLLGPWERVEAAARDVLARAGGRPGHIFNLGPRRAAAHRSGRRLAACRLRPGGYGGGACLRLAVILMAYGSPERVADVPAYYADIRGGRPIAPENLEDLVARYRALGIEDSNPLNAITEATRAALEAELGLPVFTGMKHWDPRIADAVDAALAAGATRLVGLVLAPHYSRLSIAGYQRLLDEAVAGRAGVVFVESWHDDPGLDRVPRRPHPRHRCARRLHRALASGAHPRRG